ncbi:MAG: ABC transporter ATP-binding protein [Eubacteriales bacterium]|nr:ABC transporter ATP-binding protein [Eubacteriales bacterium]
MIEIQNVTKRYGSVYALRDVSLTVEKGTVLGLLGQNGAGKTTLLNILTGYLAPTSGRALLDGHDSLLEPEEAKRHLGYLPEQPPLYDEMTVQEYLAFAAELKGVKKSSIPAHIDEVMELCGLGAMRGRLLSHLSKGYRQRAGFAQALCGDPDILVLDEPTVGLDPKQITEIRGLIRTLGKGRTILFSSHILSEVQQLCDHVVILHEGAVKTAMALGEENDPDEITLQATVAAAEKSIVSRLRQLDGVRRVTVLPTAHSDQTMAQITFYKQPEPERRLFSLLSSLSIPLLELSRVQDSLEQVFLKAISDTM